MPAGRPPGSTQDPQAYDRCKAHGTSGDRCRLPAVNDGEFCGHHILRGADLEDKVPELDDLAQQLYRVGRLVETQRLEPAVGRAVAYIAKVTLETKLLSNAGRPKVSELNLTPEQLQAMPPDQRQALLEAYRRSQEN